MRSVVVRQPGPVVRGGERRRIAVSVDPPADGCLRPGRETLAVADEPGERRLRPCRAVVGSSMSGAPVGRRAGRGSLCPSAKRSAADVSCGLRGSSTFDCGSDRRRVVVRIGDAGRSPGRRSLTPHLHGRGRPQGPGRRPRAPCCGRRMRPRGPGGVGDRAKDLRDHRAIRAARRSRAGGSSCGVATEGGRDALELARRDAGLSVADLFVAYFALGGAADRGQLVAYLNGDAEALDRHQRDSRSMPSTSVSATSGAPISCCRTRRPERVRRV